MTRNYGIAGVIARVFVDSKLTPLLIAVSAALGLLAIVLLPREEEPQIRAPMADIVVAMPGASAAELESRVSSPLERLVWEIPGVEHVYSTSQPGRSLVIVRFNVGEDVERSLVRLHQKLQENVLRMPPGASVPVVKARSIDDVPILALTFHSSNVDQLALRRVAAEVAGRIKRLPDVSETTLTGGYRRQVRVHLERGALAARSLAPSDVLGALGQSNQRRSSGSLTIADQDVVVQTGTLFTSAEDVGAAVVGVHAGTPVRVSDVARVDDEAEEPNHYVFHRSGRAAGASADEPAVTLSIAKRPGTNAVTVADKILEEVSHLKGTTIPNDITVSVTRHYGETAAERSNELLLHMAIAVISVALLMLLMLGWRESAVVAIAIPSTLALTLLVFQLVGYTLNRITLFALIFSIGILVDDAIVVIENIVRHRELPENRDRSLAEVAVAAVGEVGNTTILATLAVIAAILPMAFVGGLMGPYMRPIPVASTAAMVFSMLVAFVVTPWAATRMLRRHPRVSLEAAHGAGGRESRATAAYRRLMVRLVGRSGWRWSFLALIALLLASAMAFIPLRLTKVKMLPFDNKSELQIVLNMPEGSSLERTAQAAHEIADAVSHEPEIADVETYVGTAAPFNFNGLVRHYYLREGASVADVQVNLVGKHARAVQSHEFAMRLRPRVAAIALRYGARVALSEVPPGPPVLQTLVAEVYAPDGRARQRLAGAVRDLFARSPGVVDVDWLVEDPHPKDRLVIDKEKAALHGIDARAILRTLGVVVAGESGGLLHAPREQEEVDVIVDLPRRDRATTEDLLTLRVHDGARRTLVPLGELVRIVHDVEDTSLYHKDLMPVVYVTGDVAGGVESVAYAILDMSPELRALDGQRYGGPPGAVRITDASTPSNDARPTINWDGEWQITLEVFRDLGAAFAVVMVLIYALLVGWFRSFVTPLVIMAAIPFSLVGILPAHAALGAFFTATSMVGFMAGAGIVVRNSIILVDFIEARVAAGVPLEHAVVDAGVVRFRPMLLTALAVVCGASVLLFDPGFQGLAISLIAGEIASLLVSRVAVPVLYSMALRRRGTRVTSATDVARPVLSTSADSLGEAAQ